MVHRFKIIILLTLGLSVAVPEIPVISTFLSIETAHAQKKRRTLFDIFRVKRRERRERLRAKVRRDSGITRSSNRNRNTATRSNVPKRKKTRAVAAAPAKPKVEKAENAARVLVVGDFIASGIARELERLYKSNPNVLIVSKTSAASGIVRYDVVNWEEEIPAQIEEHKPIVVVNLLGMNDRQEMRLPDGRVKALSEPWMEAYSGRVTNIANFSTQFKVPMLWVGLPPVKFNKMNADYLTFNELYRSKIEAVGGTFVDVWDGFTNEEGKFVSAGPDINGQIVRLRGSKGINMTRAGNRKMAFYVDRELRKFGISADNANLQLSTLGSFTPAVSQPKVPEYDPAGTGTTVVISLGAADIKNPEALAGGDDFLKADGKEKSVSFNLVEKGISYEPKSGRVDAGWGIPATPESKEKKEDEATAKKPDERASNTQQTTQ